MTKQTIKFPHKHCNNKNFNELEILKHLNKLNEQNLTKNEKQLIKALNYSIIHLSNEKHKKGKALAKTKDLFNLLAK